MNNNNNIEDWLDDEQLWIEKEDHSIYPIDRDKIQVTVNNWNIFNIVTYIKRWDIELQPNFQRSYVWDDEKAEKLIDSVWKGLPIPQLFLLTKEDGSSLVIDWQQRLTSIIRFMLLKNEISSIQNLDDLSFEELKVSKSIFTWDIENDKNIKVSFNDLDSDTKRKFENESLIVAQIKPTYSLFKDKKEDLEKLSKEIFYRLNTWWVKLTSQEIRHSLYHKDFMRSIKEISFSTEWKNLIPVNIWRFKNEKSLLSEMLLRAFSLLDTYWNKENIDTIWNINRLDWSKFFYFKPLNQFLDEYASISDKFTENQISDRIELLKKVIKILNELFTDGSFFKHQNVINLKTSKVRPNTFNMKYVDTLFVWLLNLFRYNTKIKNDFLKEKIIEFKWNSKFIEEYISKPWSSEPNYVEDRVKSSIAFFESLKNN